MRLTAIGCRPLGRDVFPLKDDRRAFELRASAFEFLMVKLLRAYGECLGARSR
jgi:hypothetical protein